MKTPISNLQVLHSLLLFCFVLFLSGCAGIGIWQPLQEKPYTFFKGGDQFGRDQMTNRRIIANGKLFLKGKSANEVLSLLGQPQEIRTIEQNVSQDWYFVYYKGYLPYVDKITERTIEPRLAAGAFIVKIHRDRVSDVVKLN